MSRGLTLHKALDALWRTPPGWGRLSAVNHTTVGLRFIVAAAVFFAIGGLLAMLIRAQLATPGSAFLGPVKTVANAERSNPWGSTASGSTRRRPQFVPATDKSIIAAIAWVQLATRIRMPRTSKSSAVPASAASTPTPKAPPEDQRPTRIQNGSALHQ